MKTKVCFASQGELIRLTFDAFGVLPRKEVSRDDFDEAAKKNIQKQLQRLAKEEGHLTKNFGEAVEQLGSILLGYLPSTRLMQAIGAPLADLHDTYNEVVRSEGTFLDKAQTLRYFISIKAVPQLVMSLNWSLLRYKIADFELETPDDEFWYLPSNTSAGKLITPLAKVMRWTYERCGISQTQFHYPGKNADTDNNKLQHNLDNAFNWIAGSSLPSLPALMKNFRDSFKALADSGRAIPDTLQASILTTLVFARVTSYIAEQVVRFYDADYLEDVCTQWRDYAQWIADDINEFKTELQPVMQKQVSPESAWLTWQHALIDFWGFFHAKVDFAADMLQRIENARSDQPIRENRITTLATEYGRFAVYTCMNLYQRKVPLAPPEGFVDMVIQGFTLKRDSSTQWSQIDEYAERIKLHGLEEHLCWMEPWLRAVYHYRKEDFKPAMAYYQTAFELAKYRAGKQQYDLVNQFIEVAAKNDSRRRFKKGIEWAQYMNIKVRWLRDDEPTEEKLDYVYHMLKRARYDHQL
ncbi:hypothetical protein CP336_19685 [Pseudomonas fluorescens]|nr:hypothetical protein CP336_19685 [Pseudomonas fluorescens]